MDKFLPLIKTEETQWLESTQIEYKSFDLGKSYFQHWRETLDKKKDRRGEIAFAIFNEHRKILLHTKTFYPEGIYRIPTGGLSWNETIVQGFERELYEETSLKEEKYTFKTALFYTFRNSHEIPFISYLFFVYTQNPIINPVDESESISHFKWVNNDEFRMFTERLVNLEGEWSDWGKVRSAPHKLVLSMLE